MAEISAAVAASALVLALSASAFAAMLEDLPADYPGHHGPRAQT